MEPPAPAPQPTPESKMPPPMPVPPELVEGQPHEEPGYGFGV